MKFNCGTVEGTGAVISVTCGFIPDYVVVVNYDGNAREEWIGNSAMGAADAQKIESSGTDAGDVSKLTTTGITVTDVDSTFLGFYIAVDSDVNVANETIGWVAMAR
jgi:hypothetical protein